MLQAFADILYFYSNFAMHCFVSQKDDLFFNLALEEYLLHNRDEDFFFIWTTGPAVVIGKHQITVAEINNPYVRRNGIRVARRLSGGGTVFHDKGNINFVFITREQPGQLINFGRYALPVMECLESLGLRPVLGDHHDLLVQGFKVSGNAMHVYKNRVLHHGTLLFNADLAMLRMALSADTHRYSSRAVQSKRTRVANLKDLLKQELSQSHFTEVLLNHMITRLRAETFNLTSDEIVSVEQLAASKYAGWEWVYGYSPEYRFEHEFVLNREPVQIMLGVNKGLISRARIDSVQFKGEPVEQLCHQLNGCRHDWEAISKVVREMKDRIPEPFQSEDFMQAFF